MPKINKNSEVSHPTESMFELVKDVDSYSNFLPWCEESSSHQIDENSVLAEVKINYKGIPFKFSTVNVHERNKKITMKLSNGPFKFLKGHWEFTEIDKYSCKIGLFLEWKFSNFIIEKTIGFIFNEISEKLIKAFVKQADEQKR